MPFDGISLHFYAKELNRKLAQARLDKIWQINAHVFILSFRQPGNTTLVELSCQPSSPSIRELNTKPPVLSVAPMFCMLLRKHLQGTHLNSIFTDNYERIVKFNFSGRNELGDATKRSLVFELMGRYSNLILLNENEIILDSCIHVDSRINRYREIMPARAYVLPPAQNKYSAQELLELLADEHNAYSSVWSQFEPSDNIKKALLSILAGFSPMLVEELLFRAKIDNKLSVAGLSSNDWISLTAHTIAILSEISKEKITPCIVFSDTTKKHPLAQDFHVINISFAETKTYSNISTMLMNFYSTRELSDKLNQASKELEKKININLKKLDRLTNIHAQEYEESQDYQQLQEEADLIVSNMHNLSQNTDKLVCEDFYNDNVVREIALNPHISPNANAQNKYKQYSKLKRKFLAANEHLKNDRMEQIYLTSLIWAIDQAENLEELALIKDEYVSSLGKKHKNQDKIPQKFANSGFYARKQARMNKNKAKHEASQELAPRTYTSSDGLTIRVGRNNQQNDKLSLRLAKKTDLWFHVKNEAGSHVVLSTNQRDNEDISRSIDEAAGLAVWFSAVSKQLNSSGIKADVDYCLVSELKKPPHAKPGMVIYKTYNSIRSEALNPETLERP